MLCSDCPQTGGKRVACCCDKDAASHQFNVMDEFMKQAIKHVAAGKQVDLVLDGKVVNSFPKQRGVYR